ncbi:hypothetical protein SETIT_8G209300v2 [Setaria italica]|uniref:Uncharacterized protein n=1 Tax=Setaria italica TaxID=4555 RepID=A0A368SA76_SETIT|nr:hypothetical protein SETIT_8G209300v2 [Setaria italica]
MPSWSRKMVPSNAAECLAWWCPGPGARWPTAPRDCGAENTLKPGDVIQYRECGYLILY